LPATRPSASLRRALANIAERAGLAVDQVFMTYAVEPSAGWADAAPRGKPAAPATPATPATRYHLAVSTPAGAERASGVPRSAVAALAREVDGRIVGYRIYLQR
jgi:hypothetical protein